MTHWSWWMSGLALAGVMIFHWLTTHRMMAVSGRFTALVNRVRHSPPAPAPEMSADELLAAIQDATLMEFDADAVDADAVDADAMDVDGKSDSDESAAVDASMAGAMGALPEMPVLTLPSTTPQLHHLLFFGGIVLGGALSLWLAGGDEITLGLRGGGFSQLTGGSPIASAAILALGGALVGFGTRMAGGCTSGHGLCGLSRVQTGSMVATACFFGVGIAVSFALQALL